MALQALGYVGIGSADLEKWAGYATQFLGMQRVDKSRTTLALRMDDRKQRVIVTADGGAASFYGWEAGDAAALDALGGRLERAGIKVARGSRALADERHVKDLIVFTDPIGNRLEAFHGAEIASEPFRPGRSISGFRTGPLGMGHAVLTVERLDDVIPFYRDVLGFGLSDYILKPFKAYFLHVNPRHHSLAFLETGKNGIHHMMVELFSLDDVGQAYDIALMEPEKIGATLGRHTNDYMTSFYSWSPSGFMVEYGWGGRLVEPGSWTAEEYTTGPSLWGHERAWLSEDKRAQARAMRTQLAADGVRAPVQVLAGNHDLMPGTCPWWDAAVAPRKAG
ncbi:MAG: biphenyl 2,3-dioxygenase [Alphaproteobacteria bacterium]|nr:MAG: biphenyl 2,3-dioxygenase [Alphaproteobacteria bacterium]